MYRLSIVTIGRLVLGFCLLSSVNALMGCGKGWFRDRSGDYVQEIKAEPVLKIPKDVKAEPFSTEYQIPLS